MISGKFAAQNPIDLSLVYAAFDGLILWQSSVIIRKYIIKMKLIHETINKFFIFFYLFFYFHGTGCIDACILATLAFILATRHVRLQPEPMYQNSMFKGIHTT